MHQHEKINYVEFPAKDLKKAMRFFEAVFGWKFTEYGESYVAFDCQGIEGGFYLADSVSAAAGGALIVFYSRALEETRAKILAAGGRIARETFSFPGGRRFHFSDPNGNEYAVWTDIN